MKEASEAVDLIVRTIEMWNEGKTIELARNLEVQFSILRVIIGSNFNELNAFVRIEREVKRFIDERENQKGDMK